MKATTSRTGLHKVRVGDRVVRTSDNRRTTGEIIVTKVGRKLVHALGWSFHIDGGGGVDGCGSVAWHPDDYEASVRRDAKMRKIRGVFDWLRQPDLTESQLDRILAILEEVQS